MEIINTANSAPERTTVIEEVNTNLTYIGIAKFGSSESAGVWQIRKIEKVGAVTHIQYADGNRRFDNVWDDRASLSYSN